MEQDLRLKSNGILEALLLVARFKGDQGLSSEIEGLMAARSFAVSKMLTPEVRQESLRIATQERRVKIG